jgi:hypothetical protein
LEISFVIHEPFNYSSHLSTQKRGKILSVVAIKYVQ